MLDDTATGADTDQVTDSDAQTVPGDNIGQCINLSLGMNTGGRCNAHGQALQCSYAPVTGTDNEYGSGIVMKADNGRCGRPAGQLTGGAEPERISVQHRAQLLKI